MPKIVDQIRKALEKRDGLSDEVMAPLANTYAADVNRVNSRLDEAVALLRKGLRSEAIQRASLTPNAIDGAADLDFPEIDEWLEILQFLQVPVPPVIDQDAVLQLNEAIVETQPLNQLLNRHRRLAIAKAPLAWRLRVLRRIALLDPMNHVWEEDLEAWETVRLKQIPVELKAAVKQENVEAVASLREELVGESWRVEPSELLTEEASRVADTFAHAASTTQLQTIAPKLHEAFGEFNVDLARSLRDDWRAVQSTMKLPVAVDVQENVAPALAWLEGLDQEEEAARQRSEAIGALETTLDTNGSVSELQRAYQQASGFDEPIPVGLEQRFRVIVAEHELRGKRKVQALIVTIVAVTVLTGSWIAYSQWTASQEQRIASTVQQMQDLLDDSKFSEAQQFIDRISSTDPNAFGDARMQSLLSQLNGAIEKEANRAKEFANYLKKADHEDPSQIDASALSKAEKLAITEAEQAAVFDVRQRRSRYERELQAEHTNSASAELDDLASQLDRIESSSASSEGIQQVTVLAQRIDGVSLKFPRRSRGIDGRIRLLKTRAVALSDAMSAKIRRTKTRAASLKRLLDSKSLPAFADNLQAYSRDVPDSLMSKEFDQVAGEAALWEKALKTNELLRLLRISATGGISPKEAGKVLDAYSRIVVNVSRNPALDALPDLQERMVSVKNREAILDQAFNDLSLQTVSELVTIEAPLKDDPDVLGRYFLYYSHFDRFRDRFKSNGRVGIEVVVNESAAVGQLGFLGPLEIVPEPRETVKWLINLKNDERDRFLSDWNGAFLETAGQIRKRPNVDGTIKEILIMDLLKGGMQGSEYLQSTLADSIKLLERRSEARRRWYVPKRPVDSLASEVERLVVPDLVRAYENRDQDLETLRSASKFEYEWVGLLMRHASGTITTEFHSPMKGTGALYVARQSLSDPSKVDFAEIGTWKQDHAILGSSIADLVAGRPLFYLKNVDDD